MTTDTVRIPDINLEQHELETITAVMGALNLPIDRKFTMGPYNNDSLTTVKTEFCGTTIEIETRKRKEGFFLGCRQC